MRLIDADALFDKLFHAWGTEIDAGTANEFMGMINDAPTITPQPDAPLTLEELREMDGEPVWVERPGYGKKWALVQVWAKSSNIIYLTYNNGSKLSQLQVELGRGAKVYRRRPEGAPGSVRGLGECGRTGAVPQGY